MREFFEWENITADALIEKYQITIEIWRKDEINMELDLQAHLWCRTVNYSEFTTKLGMIHNGDD